MLITHWISQIAFRKYRIVKFPIGNGRYRYARFVSYGWVEHPVQGEESPIARSVNADSSLIHVGKRKKKIKRKNIIMKTNKIKKISLFLIVFLLCLKQ